jgi:hypothetical protein
MGTSRLAVITFVDGGQVDNTLPGGGPYPSPPIYLPPPSAGQLPVYGGGGHPSQPIYLPPPGQAVQLPVFPYDPEKPDHELPPYAAQLPIMPGRRYIVKWLACLGLILVPDHTLPGDMGHPDHTLPGGGGYPDHTLPGGGGHPDHTLPGGRPGKPDNTLPDSGKPTPKV